MKSYPRQMPPTWSYGHQRPGAEKCDQCGQPIGKNDRVCVIETQVSYMRGDDEVEFICEPCAVSRRITPPPTKAQRRYLHLVNTQAGLKKKVATLKKQLTAAERNLADVEHQIAKFTEAAS